MFNYIILQEDYEAQRKRKSDKEVFRTTRWSECVSVLKELNGGSGRPLAYVRFQKI